MAWMESSTGQSGLIAGDGTEQLSFRDYLEVVRRRWTLIAVVVIVIAALAFGFTTRQTPQYQATAEVQFDFDPASLIDGSTGTSSSQRLIENELRFLTSTVMADAVEEELGQAVKFSARKAGDTDSMLLTVQGSDPEAVAVAANAYAERYISVWQERNAQKYLATGQGIRAAIVAELNSRIEAADDVDEQARLERQRSFYQEQLATLDLSATVERESGVAASIISQAERPTLPVEPSAAHSTVLASIVGLILGVAVALLLEYLDDTVKQKQDLERASGWSVPLALVPEAERGEHRLVSLERPNSEAAEAYRSLRTSIQFAGLCKHLGSLQLTSAAPGDGKTTTACNLAAVTALAGQQVVLIDCDLRSPRVHEHFGLANDVGFTNLLFGEVTVDEVLQPIDDVDGLYVISSGSIPPNPTELLGAMPMPEMVMTTPQVFEELAARGMFVIVDGPSVLPVADALVLSYVVDGTVFVASSGGTSAKHISRALEQLRQVEANVLGTVLNNIKVSASGYGHGYVVEAESTPSRWARLVQRRGQRPIAIAPARSVKTSLNSSSSAAAPSSAGEVSGLTPGGFDRIDQTPLDWESVDANSTEREANSTPWPFDDYSPNDDSPNDDSPNDDSPHDDAPNDYSPDARLSQETPGRYFVEWNPVEDHSVAMSDSGVAVPAFRTSEWSGNELSVPLGEIGANATAGVMKNGLLLGSNGQHRFSSLSREASGRRRTAHRSRASGTGHNERSRFDFTADPVMDTGSSLGSDALAPIVTTSRRLGAQSDVAFELGDGITVDVSTSEHS